MRDRLKSAVTNPPELSPSGTIIYLLGSLAVRGWALMVVLGMLAGYAAVPGLAVGFFPALAMAVLIRLMLWVSSNNNNKR